MIAENPNLPLLIKAAEKLTPLLDQIVFVGGGVTGLLVTDPASSPARSTLDVDVIAEIVSYSELRIFEERLHALGFRQPSNAPICRWSHENAVLDLMPTAAPVLGFTNSWYAPAFKNAGLLSVDKFVLRVISAPYFLGTKLEAFHGRGQKDYRLSRDIEDIATVIDGRREILEEVRTSETTLRKYLAKDFRMLLADPNFRDALPGHLPPDTASQGRISLLLNCMRSLAAEEC